ncbi:hypothetical protein DMENIID0001_019300 [Sergentomyia squamirostris]
MEQWKNRVAVITGASSGIGAAIAKDLVKAGMITIGIARRVDRIEDLKKDLSVDLQGNLHAIKCDITNEAEILKCFVQIENQFNGIDVLINSAGIFPSVFLTQENNSAVIREVIDINILGAVFCTREAFKSMSKHGRNSHVIHINSVFGHLQPRFNAYSGEGIYYLSKHALRIINEVHRQEFIQSKHHIKVSSVSPGVVYTEMAVKRSGKHLSEMPYLLPEDVSQNVLHVLGTPPHVQIHELIIKPFGEE